MDGSRVKGVEGAGGGRWRQRLYVIYRLQGQNPQSLQFSRPESAVCYSAARLVVAAANSAGKRGAFSVDMAVSHEAVNNARSQ